MQWGTCLPVKERWLLPPLSLFWLFEGCALLKDWQLIWAARSWLVPKNCGLVQRWRAVLGLPFKFGGSQVNWWWGKSKGKRCWLLHLPAQNMVPKSLARGLHEVNCPAHRMGFTTLWLNPQSTAGEKILWPIWTLRQVFRHISLIQEVRPMVIWLTGRDVLKPAKMRTQSPLLSSAGIRLDALRAREWPRSGAGGGGGETKPSLLSGSGSSWSAGLTTWSIMMDWVRGRIHINWGFTFGSLIRCSPARNSCMHVLDFWSQRERQDNAPDSWYRSPRCNFFGAAWACSRGAQNICVHQNYVGLELYYVLILASWKQKLED